MKKLGILLVLFVTAAVAITLYDSTRSSIFEKSNYWSDTDSSIKREARLLRWDVRGEKVLRVSWDDGAHSYRVTMEKFGASMLPNIRSIEHRTSIDGKRTNWKQVSNTSSDWLPPIVVKSLKSNNSSLQSFTGGVQSSNGMSDGNKTAKNMEYKIIADGFDVNSGSGQAKDVTIYIANGISAYNTLHNGKIVIRQNISMTFRDGGIYIDVTNTALDDIGIFVDYGLQAITYGFKGDFKTYGRVDSDWAPYIDSDNDSGSKSQSPGAWAYSFRDYDVGTMTLWIDRGFADGDRYIDDSQKMLRISRLSKAFLSVILADKTKRPDGYIFDRGDSYTYRAGIAFTPLGKPITLFRE
ncbi:hypothetical protein WF331_21300 [Pseudomonas sp. YNh]|uniref:hypothetical protein n=1 Tax=Pseudomonas TaxID=286 RepID=UPI0024E04F99|nr:hypothetical protein [Pseudomonas putida]HDS0985857.1 hypothetical protein [Pseudomonas putida]